MRFTCKTGNPDYHVSEFPAFCCFIQFILLLLFLAFALLVLRLTALVLRVRGSLAVLLLCLRGSGFRFLGGDLFAGVLDDLELQAASRRRDGTR